MPGPAEVIKISAINFLFELEPRPTLRGVRVQCFQTAKGYGNASIWWDCEGSSELICVELLEQCLAQREALVSVNF